MDNPTISAWLAHGLYGLAWFMFGLIHSLTARLSFKQRFGAHFGPFYRLTYNALSVFLVGLVYLCGMILLSDGLMFSTGLWGLGAVGLGCVLMIAALRHYDLGAFSGLRQIREKAQDLSLSAEEDLHITGLHRYMRHPIYTAAFLILWGRVSDELSLATAFWGSLYLIIGSQYEERALVAEFGVRYETYQAQVPAFIPWKKPWVPEGG